MSAALGVRAAQLGRRVLVLTVDPAKRLATALGLELHSSDIRAVPLAGVSGSLSAAVIDAKKVFDDFIQTHGSQAEIVSRIMKNRLYQQLSTTLAGSQEFTALERLLQAAESHEYDLVILDTPPTKHAMDFLRAPDRINALFQDSVTKWFMSPEIGTGFIAGLLSRGTRAALKTLESFTGAAFIEELLDFFAAIRSIQTVLRDRSMAVRRLLTSQEACFVVVTSFDAAKLKEAAYLQGELAKMGYKLAGAIVNRAYPVNVPENDEKMAGSEAYDKVLNFYKSFKEYYASRYNLYQEFTEGLGRDVHVVRVPEYQRDIYGLADLESLAGIMGEART